MTYRPIFYHSDEEGSALKYTIIDLYTLSYFYSRYVSNLNTPITITCTHLRDWPSSGEKYPSRWGKYETSRRTIGDACYLKELC